MIKTYLGSVRNIYISSLITFFIAGVQLILSSYYEIYFLMIVFSIISLGYFVFLILLSVDLKKKIQQIYVYELRKLTITS